MRSWMIAYSLGIMVVAKSPSLPSMYILLIAVAGSVLLLFICLRNNYSSVKRLAITLLLFLMGVSWHCFWADSILRQRIPLALEGQDILVTGEVVSLPQRKSRYQQFSFDIGQSKAGFDDRLILLNYYGPHLIVPGQQWQFSVRLNQPHGFANPGGFDYEAWLFQQGFSAKGYVRASDANAVIRKPGLSGIGLRFAMLQKLSQLTADLEYGGVILALSMGDRSQLSQQQWQLFTDTGTNHLMVISGLHVGFVAGLFYLLINNAVRLIPALLLCMPAQKVAALAAILAALAYSFLAGFSLPTQRAVVMISVYMISIVLARNITPMTSLGLALVIVLTLNPLSVVSAGFWLSFIAVSGLLLTASPAGSSAWNRFIKPQLIVFLALLVPLSIWLQQISFMTPLANFLAIPLISLLVVPLCLCALVTMIFSESITLVLFTIIDQLLAALLFYLQWLRELQPDLIHWNFTVVFPIAYGCAGLACGLLLLPFSRKLRCLALPLVLPLFFPRVPVLHTGELHMHVADVGQGLAVVVQTRNHVLVYDAGPQFSDDFSAGSAVLYPALQALGISQVDTLVISHGDNDHAGGASGLLASIPVNEIISSADLAGLDRSVQVCQEGQSWTWDKVDFVILHPNSDTYSNDNDHSCVLKVQLGEHALLLPGDIEVTAERRLMRDYGDELRSNVLIVPHHGSNTSSSLSFVARVRPALVIYSSGYQNQFGHPTARVRQRYEQINANSYVTAHTGMISLLLRPGQTLPAASLYRRSNPRYWQATESEI